jgi:hypothetical protein
MKKLTTFWALLAVMMFCITTRAANAQEDEAKADAKSKTDQAERPRVQPYRLDFSLLELQDGKATNTRRYSMLLNVGDHREINIGTRVPVVTSGPSGNPVADTQYQYMDVGTRVDANLQDRNGDLTLAVGSDISNIDANASPVRIGSTLHPIIRNMHINGSTVITSGKAIVVGSVDDPNSTRQFELEVTATKLR